MNFLNRCLAPFAGERYRAGGRGVLVLALLVLAPVAYLTAIVLGSRLETGGVRFLPPERAIERARAVARDARVDVSGWREVVSTVFENDLRTYFDDPRYRELSTEAKRFAPYASVVVTFVGSGPGRWVSVTLRPDGSLLGVRLAAALERAPRSVTDEEAREIASAELQRLLAPPASFGLRQAEMAPGESPGVRRFRWEADFPKLPEFRTTFLVDLSGDRLMAARQEFAVDAATLAARDDARTRLLRFVQTILMILLACFGLYSFARRSMEKEVALARCGILFASLLVPTLLMAFAHPGRFLAGLDPERLGGGVMVLTLLGAVVGSWASGVMLALCYGGSEGELREIYPGKLTSLDALLTMRWFSSNVGSAVVFGVAVAGWALLVCVLGEQVFRSHVPRFAPGEVLLSYVPFGWVPLLLAQPVVAFLSTVFGLLLPLRFANRHVTRPAWRRGVIVVLALLGSSVAGQSIDFAQPWTVWRVLVYGALMLITFWSHDFLSSIVATNLFLVGHSVSLLAPLGGDWLGVVRFVVMFTVLTTVLALAATYRAPALSEEQVRPKYAERLLERLGLQAEVSAAREAQLRLLPTSVPRIAGWRVAAACVPAREVGGDFYDFFPLAGGGLGVLVAEGGSTGLASALSIGLAKGFLLYAAERQWTPGESLRRLRPVLTRAVKGNIDRLGLAYLAFEADGSLRAARFGAYPQLMELIPGQAPREVQLLGEAEVDFVGERTWTLPQGTLLLVVTDGLAERIVQRTERDLASWLGGRTEGNAEALHAALLKDASALELDDDLTLVLVERERLSSALREGVA